MIDATTRSSADASEPLRLVNDEAVESRLDPISGNWTIFAPHRVQRPEEFLPQQDFIAQRIECPFCPGMESATPPAVWIGRVSEKDASLEILDQSKLKGSTPEWSVRVVPNKYPAVSESCDSSASHGEHPLFQRRPVAGGHEVIIESRSHVESLSQLDLSEVQLVFHAFRDRLRHWRDVPSVKYVTAFKNAGARAGASLRHTHSQIIATNRIPVAVRQTLEHMQHHHAASGCCLHCDLIRGEVKTRQRVVWRDDTLIAYCPFASHLPMLVRITSLNHQPCFEEVDDPTLESTARLVRRVVSWLEIIRPGTAYNFCLHTRPPGANDPPDAFHWWLEIFPRMSQIAGFEWSSQCMINPVLPEIAAAKLRSCARAEDPRIVL